MKRILIILILVIFSSCNMHKVEFRAKCIDKTVTSDKMGNPTYNVLFTANGYVYRREGMEWYTCKIGEEYTLSEYTTKTEE